MKNYDINNNELLPVYANYSVECRWCHAPIGQPCKEKGRVHRYMHTPRFRDIYRKELERRRMVRERYLTVWLTKYGDIFQE